ncbi:MAG TPA: hypothetical protein EYM39_11990 [Candidatus Latescibacteria bacterium]|nr:hypothetical protein [Candidatus Latescibacterota bacterium]
METSMMLVIRPGLVRADRPPPSAYPPSSRCAGVTCRAGTAHSCRRR